MKRAAVIAIANACIWGFVLIASALALKGTGAFEKGIIYLTPSCKFTIILVDNMMGGHNEPFNNFHFRPFQPISNSRVSTTVLRTPSLACWCCLPFLC